jgi:hypothetical protein
MKTYIVTFTKEIEVQAENQEKAQQEAINQCADDSEVLMPHNMFVYVTLSPRQN